MEPRLNVVDLVKKYPLPLNYDALHDRLVTKEEMKARVAKISAKKEENPYSLTLKTPKKKD